MKYIFFVILLLASLSNCFAQDSLLTPHLIFKIAPLSLVDLDNTFQFGAEHGLRSKRWTLSEEFGYGTAYTNLWGGLNNNSKYRETFRAKIEFRKYKQAFSGFYYAYEGFYKQVNDQLERSVGRECENGLCNYYERGNFPVSKYVVGLTAKIGHQVRIKNQLGGNSNFIFDFYVGLGLRRVMINHRDSDESSSFNFTNSIFNNNGLGYTDKTYNIPHVAFGIKLGYIIF